MNAIWVVVIASVTTSIIAPIVSAWVARNSRKQEWARQDQVADRAREVAQQAVEAAKLLITSNQQIATVARETSAEVARTAEVTNGKLDQIHTLVNSNMTAAMRSELDAVIRTLAMMQELIAVKKANGLNPSPKTLAVLATTQQKVDELKAAMADRMEQTVVADFQLEQATTDTTTEPPTQYRRVD